MPTRAARASYCACARADAHSWRCYTAEQARFRKSTNYRGFIHTFTWALTFSEFLVKEAHTARLGHWRAWRSNSREAVWTLTVYTLVTPCTCVCMYMCLCVCACVCNLVKPYVYVCVLCTFIPNAYSQRQLCCYCVANVLLIYLYVANV